MTAGPELPFASVSPSRPAAPHGSVAGPRVEVDTGLRFQQIAGFGGSFTDSSAFLIDRELDAAERERAMTLLFDPRSGIGLSLLRNPMGASDYARDVYTYDDVPEGESDPQLSRFSIDHDRESIVPLTRWAKRLNPDLQVFASPWSAPGWMKD
ncbi:MAG: glycosyl hydrolase, partial [Proteobacteria bacterium]|nr:glycosyl hydrolase [Pseudomonadota bacterium]